MTIQAILDSAMTDLFNTVGEDATYTPVTGDACACKVWVMKDVEMQPFDFNAQAVERQTILECLVSEVSETPQRGATFLAGTTTYTVQSVKENDGRILKLVVK